MNNIVIILIAMIGCTMVPKLMAEKVMDKIKNKQLLSALTENVVLVAIFMICVFYLVAGSYNPFLYFRF